MANVLMCDSCGKITTRAAAKMFIVLNPSFDDDALGQSRQHAQHRADKEMDLCEDCLKKLIDQQPKMELVTGEVVAKI